MNARFAAAMTAYGVLALLAALFLSGTPRTAVWIFLGGLALKTVIVVASRKGEE
jgi:hypothetical protein